ncbi:MAG: rhodanese-like domain-containing protein [Gammaproteobacteria bacterium]|nr:rhodanese-like domain-containing protein [Gammaproteobacteria bacterium]MBU1554077.1 rhodanese-like domain-containing protein [Gammaproteobacteria bacterium]MBU2069944.1 rhodanese-like domain-containing protein [Gammaproteobacteria bacterium]MBU2185089.1 rhodanese-like domain-containing protein [Gammaproteobacteria bacterium]MBU2206957.1 rhodanese-like domain-containing protein [Gammaproteobacteria bacterium]
MACQAQDIPNRLIDYALFAQNVSEVATLRRQHRISETQFIAMAQQQDVVILDARSERMFNRLHVKGAVNLSFPDFTEQELAKIIPSKNTTILIYCNNNFNNAPSSFPVKTPAASLNVHTYTALHSYGYQNIHELGPSLDVTTTAIELVGTEHP